MSRPYAQYTALACLSGVLLCGAAASARPSASPRLWYDAVGDSVVRGTDPGNDGTLCTPAALPELISVAIGGWSADDAEEDPYTGHWEDDEADLLRVDLTLSGLFNPPGTLGLGGVPFNPTAWGNRPLFGFVEFDVDSDADTGGECDSQSQLRYPAVIPRFGARPDSAIAARIPAFALQMDSDFQTSPQFERSGQDFTLMLCGCFNTTIIETFGDEDGTFDAGDRWIVRGRYFRRAGGYIAASSLAGPPGPGQFQPQTTVRFSHDAESDQTVVTMVFPLTQAGAAALRGEPEQPIDTLTSNHTSVEEALADVIANALTPTNDCTQTLISGWFGQNSDDFLTPSEWGVTAVLATAYCVEEPGAPYVWTDTGFGETYGDVSGDGELCASDAEQVREAIEQVDGTLADGDGVLNGSIELANFAGNFSLYDLNYDGFIDTADLALLPPEIDGDVNRDCTVNITDLELVLSSWALTGVGSEHGDVNIDGTVDFRDLALVLYNWLRRCES